MTDKTIVTADELLYNENLRVQKFEELYELLSKLPEQLNSLVEQTNRYKQALEEIKKMLKISMRTANGSKHFEYVENVLKRVSEVLEDE